MQDDYRHIMKRVASVLVVIGLLDMGVAIYCFASNFGYASTLNIFAVVGGIMIWRGSLRAAATIRQLAIVFVWLPAILSLAGPFIEPLGLWLTQIRLYVRWSDLALMIVLALVASWVARELSRPTVTTAIGAAYFPPAPLAAKLAPAIVVGVLLLTNMGDGERSKHAEELAAAKLGSGYQYRAGEFRISYGAKTSVSAVVTAWNDHEIRQIPVAWDEK